MKHSAVYVTLTAMIATWSGVIFYMIVNEFTAMKVILTIGSIGISMVFIHHIDKDYKQYLRDVGRDYDT
jgi:hypothetical protein